VYPADRSGADHPPTTDGLGTSQSSDTAGTASDGGCRCRETPVPRDISLLALALLTVRRRRHALT